MQHNGFGAGFPGVVGVAVDAGNGFVSSCER
jgi:hypothetical protein